MSAPVPVPTPAQFKALRICVADGTLYHDLINRRTLNVLRARGWIEWAGAYGQYRITPAGHEALARVEGRFEA